MEQLGRDFVDIDDIYFAKVGHSIKNRLLKYIIGFIFNDRIKKKKFNFSLFSLSFKDTETIWYENFMNEFSKRVKCFFTADDEMFIVYPIIGSESRAAFTIPERSREYLSYRMDEWNYKGKWKLDESSVRGEQKKDAFILHYEGSLEDGDASKKIFEHTVFKGINKIVLQAYLQEGSRAFKDVEKISQSITITSNS